MNKEEAVRHLRKIKTYLKVDNIKFESVPRYNEKMEALQYAIHFLESAEEVKK